MMYFRRLFSTSILPTTKARNKQVARCDEMISADDSFFQRLLHCGEIVGLVQYFQHDLFLTTPQTFTFGGTLVAHEHYGRHSAVNVVVDIDLILVSQFLCVPRDQSASEEVHLNLKHIVNLFHLLYGTWNHIQSVSESSSCCTEDFRCPLDTSNNDCNAQLSSADSDTTDRVCIQPNSVHLPTVLYYRIHTVEEGNEPKRREVIVHKWSFQGNQRVLLESKHYLDFIKCTYGLEDALIGYDQKYGSNVRR